MLTGYTDDFQTEYGKDAGSVLPAVIIFFLILFFCVFCGSADHKAAPPPLSPVTCDASLRDASLICIGD